MATVATGASHVMADGITNGHVNGTTAKFASGGVILPPPEIKKIIDRTASFVAKNVNPELFEDKIRENHRQDPKFSFLNPADPYHGYYRNRMERIAEGEFADEGVTGAGILDDSREIILQGDMPMFKTDQGQEPPPPEYVMEIPPMSALDLDILKLTALFTARRGRSFLASLSTREGRNYQFEFLRPTHALFGLFNRFVEQYNRVLLPSKESLGHLTEVAAPEGKWQVLQVAREHAKWERSRREREKKREDDREAERKAFAEIDWHDYAIVQTIEFTAADASSELPLPMTVAEMESLTQAQKRMAAMIMENTVEEVEAHRAKQAAADAQAAAAAAAANGQGEDDDVEMEQSDDEDEEVKERKKRDDEERTREEHRARELQAKSLEHGGPMKIRKDYVPKTLGEKVPKTTMSTCTICGQSIPLNELDEHMRIELLDPKWKTQRDAIEARRAQANELQRGANVVSSLKNLARKLTNVFGAEEEEERRRKEEEEENARRKEREKVVWDGHTASKAGTLDKFQTNVNFDEQIAAIHRAKGLGQVDSSTIGPNIGPSITPVSQSLPVPPPSLPMNPTLASNDPAYAAATISAGPQPASMYTLAPGQAPPVMLPPLHYQGLDAAQPFGYTPPAGGLVGGMHPSRLAALSGGLPSLVGTVRSADEMDGANGAPPAKRPRVDKLPDGQYYPEDVWISFNPDPITLQIQLPLDPTKPEWKLDGSIASVPDLPLTLLVSTLRDRIISHIQATLPASRLRLAYGNKVLANSNSLASYNFAEGDLLTLTVRDAKKK